MDAVETPFTNYVYDTMNRIKEVYDSGQEVASYKYYPDHMPKSVSFANGVQVNYGYDLDKNRTQATTISPSGKVLLEHSYGYDGNGNQLWKQESQAKTSYTYDRANRLAAVNYPKRGKECFTYDLAGNRTTRQLGDTIETYTYNAKNQLMTWHTNQESTTYQYDKQGNMLSEQGLGKETTYTYEYDGFNRTVGAHLPNGGTLVHRYDPEGLRAEVEENGKLRKFLFSGRNIIAELDQEDQVTARFIRGSELLAQDDARDQRYYYHLNEHGDVTHLLDGKANVVNCYEYDAFGNTIESKEEVYNPFRYAGEQYDTATGQYYLRARFYNPVIARFTQEDVYRGDGLNLYAYVSNNPVKYVDPSGYKECKVDAVKGTETPVKGAEVEVKTRGGLGSGSKIPEGNGGSSTWDPNNGHYSTAYEAQLPQDMYPGVSSGRHFQEANRQLYETFERDPVFAQQMEQLYPEIIDGVKPGSRGAHSREKPTKDVTWHHEANREGVLQLVPTEQHTSAGAIQSVLHPNNKGGMENWGGRKR